MRVLQERATELAAAVVAKPRLDAREREGPRGAAALVEHRRAHAPASLDQEAGIHRVPGRARALQTLEEVRGGVRDSPLALEASAVEVLIALLLGEEGEESGFEILEVIDFVF